MSRQKKYKMKAISAAITETDGISINGEWLAQTLPASLACDVTFTLTTPDGTAAVSLKHG